MEKISGQSLYEDREVRQFAESAGAAPVEPTTTEAPAPAPTDSVAVTEQGEEDQDPTFDTPKQSQDLLSSKATEPLTVPHSAGHQPIEGTVRFHDFICDEHKTHSIHDSKDKSSPEKRANVEHEIWRIEEQAAANRKQSEITAEGYSASPADQAILEDDLEILRKKGLVTPKVEKEEAEVIEPEP